jgi:hypothetical protein
VKQLKRLMIGPANCRACTVSAVRTGKVEVRVYDPLAIGIEELARSFWPPARSYRRPTSLNKPREN